jgi:cysteinyl-tRNA synthetase
MLDRPLHLYNSLTHQKELFTPLHPDTIGMYVCGPTVYSDVHLGNCRTFVNFDLIYRYLLHLGYKVRYVRNITDVGHMLDDGEDRMLKGAKAMQLEPMEVAQRYTVGFHEMMRIFNSLPPSIEPRATGHIPEQIEMVQEIIENGYGYISNGSVYFDVMKMVNDNGGYGQLSGRIPEELLQESRELKNQSDKKHPADFAIWMKASDEHIMRWQSPWSVGFPGWHLECSAMSTKYLGKTFDIHGGGNDLKFPHHENEIAQNVGSCRCQPAKYWLHANMLLLNGKKMSKSDGNTLSPVELFSGESPHVTKGYSPMVARFFMLQAHYRSTLDMTDDGFQAAERGFRRLMEAYQLLAKLPTGTGTQDQLIADTIENAYDDMSDDFNAPRAMSRFFEIATPIFAISNNQLPVDTFSAAAVKKLQQAFESFIFDIFGLKEESDSQSNHLGSVMSLVLELRQNARGRKDWGESDRIRDVLAEAGIQVKDGKEGSSWDWI